MTRKARTLAEKRAKRRIVAPSSLDDVRVQAKMVRLAAMGMSRAGVSRAVGLTPSTVQSYLDRAEADPEHPVYGPFARTYLEAERKPEQELTGARAKIFAKMANAAKEANWELVAKLGGVRAINDTLKHRYPKEHGDSKHRVLDEEPLGKKWLDKNAVTAGQLRAVLRDPNENLRAALLDVYPELAPRLLTTAPELPAHIDTKGEPSDPRTEEASTRQDASSAGAPGD